MSNMVQIVVIAHSEIAASFVHCLEDILGKKVELLHIIAIKNSERDIDSTLRQAESFIKKLALHNEVLILVDLYGATPSNIASEMLANKNIKLLTGLNLAMLIRAVSYAKEGLQVCAQRAYMGAKEGIMLFGEGV